MACHHITGVTCDNCRHLYYLPPRFPTMADYCHHCYCIPLPADTGRLVPHARCCKCGDEHAVIAHVTWTLP